MMKKILLVILGVFFLTGCGPNFDQEGMQTVHDYAGKLIPLTSETIYAVNYWSRFPGADEGQEKIQQAEENMEAIEELNEEFAEKLPPREEIEKWRIARSARDRRWIIKGEDLAEALYTAKQKTLELENVDISELRDEERQLEEESIYFDEAEEAIDRLRHVLYRR